jgi:gamma-glutamylcyclotransferase (GGCT)/AIG2-like uncharacterized protein YtfP
MRTMTTTDDKATEHLFSYGTLQLAQVQRATFGRLLEGRADRLPGYRLEQLLIQDAAVVATSGQARHPIAVRSGDGGDSGDAIAGTVLVVTPAELAQADAYEVREYRRDRVTLASGQAAWVYADARQAAPAGAAECTRK